MSWFVDPATIAETMSSCRVVRPKVGCGRAAPDGSARSRMLSMMLADAFAADPVLAGHHRVNALEQQFGRRVLHHHAAGAELQRVDHVRVAHFRRQQQRAHRRRQCRELAQRGEPRRDRHHEIEQQDVGPQLRRESDRVTAVSRFADRRERAGSVSRSLRSASRNIGWSSAITMVIDEGLGVSIVLSFVGDSKIHPVASRAFGQFLARTGGQRSAHGNHVQLVWAQESSIDELDPFRQVQTDAFCVLLRSSPTLLSIFVRSSTFFMRHRRSWDTPIYMVTIRSLREGYAPV